MNNIENLPAGGWRLAVLGLLTRNIPLGGRTLASYLWRLATLPGFRHYGTFEGHVMKLDFMAPHHRWYCLGLYERTTVAEIKRLLRPGSLFIDLGANAGYFSLIAAERVGQKGKVISFEADPENAMLLRENIACSSFHNIQVHEKALGDRNGKARFRSASMTESSLSTLENENHSTDVEGSTIEVEMTTMDTLCLEEVKSWQGLKVMKMDIEGAEIMALKGAPKTFEHMDAAIVELNPELLSAHGGTSEELIDLLLGAGHEGYVIPERGKRRQPLDRSMEETANLLLIKRGTNL